MSARQFVCRCISHGCARNETTDETGYPTRGKALGIHEYWEHSRSDKRLSYLVRQLRCQGETRLKSVVHQREDDTHQPGGDAPQDTATSLPVPRASHSGGQSAGVTSQEDELAHSLESCLSIFRSGLLQDIRIDDLVFCKPSEEDDPRFPPPLQSLAIPNAQFLEYRDWIIKMFNDTHNLDCGSFERCRSIKDQLLDDIRNEWIRLDDMKLLAWQMTSRNDHAMASLSESGPAASDFGSARVIDTCKCVSFFSVARYI
jgi:hypothetical protein